MHVHRPAHGAGDDGAVLRRPIEVRRPAADTDTNPDADRHADAAPHPETDAQANTEADARAHPGRGPDAGRRGHARPRAIPVNHGRHEPDALGGADARANPAAGNAGLNAVTGGEATAEPPEPTPGATEPAAGPTPEPSLPAWDASVLAIEDVNSDGGAIGGSLLLALLLLLLIGFIGELFNNTVENNDDVIAAWFKQGPLGRVRQAFGRIRINPPGRPGVLVFIALTALISSFVDEGFGLNVRSIAVFLGFLIGLIVVLASFKLPPILARRRRTGELGQLRPLPWALVIAVVFVLTTRLAHLQPGYLYGIVLGAIFISDASDRDEGRETFWGSIWTLVAAVLAWIALTWLRGLGLPQDGFGVTLLSTAFAATLVAGLEAAAFALMPMRFLPGYVLYKWNRLAWAVLWAVSLFAFFHLLIGPTSGYVSELTPQAFLAALGVFAAFGALSIGTWLYFRFRRPTRRRAGLGTHPSACVCQTRVRPELPQQARILAPRRRFRACSTRTRTGAGRIAGLRTEFVSHKQRFARRAASRGRIRPAPARFVSPRHGGRDAR